MTSTARQLRQPPTIEAIKRVPYFADIPQHLKLFAMARITKSTALNKTTSSDFLNSSSLLRRCVQRSEAITPAPKRQPPKKHSYRS